MRDDDDRRRDALLVKILKTPPQPRPKRDRGGQAKPTSGGVESALSEPAADHK